LKTVLEENKKNKKQKNVLNTTITRASKTGAPITNCVGKEKNTYGKRVGGTMQHDKL